MLDCEITPILMSPVFEDFAVIFKTNGQLVTPIEHLTHPPGRADVQNLQLGQRAIVRLLYRIMHQYMYEESKDDGA